MKLNLQSNLCFNSAPESGTDNKENREGCDRNDRSPHPVQFPVRLTSVLTARFTWYSHHSLEEHAHRFTNVSRKPRPFCGSHLSTNLPDGYSYPYTCLDSPLRFQEVEAPRISRQSAHEGGRVVNLMHQPRKHSRYSFLLGAESTRRP